MTLVVLQRPRQVDLIALVVLPKTVIEERRKALQSLKSEGKGLIQAHLANAIRHVEGLRHAQAEEGIGLYHAHKVANAVIDGLVHEAHSRVRSHCPVLQAVLDMLQDLHVIPQKAARHGNVHLSFGLLAVVAGADFGHIPLDVQISQEYIIETSVLCAVRVIKQAAAQQAER